jgi:hypothetical protein
LWIPALDRQINRAEAEAFLAMWEEMKEIDREEAEEERVKHETERSHGENWRRGMARRGKPVT